MPPPPLLDGDGHDRHARGARSASPRGCSSCCFAAGSAFRSGRLPPRLPSSWPPAPFTSRRSGGISAAGPAGSSRIRGEAPGRCSGATASAWLRTISLIGHGPETFQGSFPRTNRPISRGSIRISPMSRPTISFSTRWLPKASPDWSAWSPVHHRMARRRPLDRCRLRRRPRRAAVHRFHDSDGPALLLHARAFRRETRHDGPRPFVRAGAAGGGVPAGRRPSRNGRLFARSNATRARRGRPTTGRRALPRIPPPRAAALPQAIARKQTTRRHAAMRADTPIVPRSCVRKARRSWPSMVRLCRGRSGWVSSSGPQA